MKTKNSKSKRAVINLAVVCGIFSVIFFILALSLEHPELKNVVFLIGILCVFMWVFCAGYLFAVREIENKIKSLFTKEIKLPAKDNEILSVEMYIAVDDLMLSHVFFKKASLLQLNEEDKEELRKQLRGNINNVILLMGDPE